jgi:ATP-dependent helicase/nuclease subunit B
LLELPRLAAVVEAVRHFHNPQSEQLVVSPALASRLYGPVLRTSVSRLEQFAACPFRFFVHSGLRAQERKKFELDVREQGSFQHDVLALYHEQLRGENKHWRDISPAQARERIGTIASKLQKKFREGLLETSEQTRFAARVMTESLQDFVETLTEWMQGQYLFDPAEVELPFGEDRAPLSWSVEVGEKQRLELYGRIDRVDLYREPKSGEAFCVVLDYKSSQKQLDTVLIWHGVQLQLLTYLNVLRRCASPREVFGVSAVRPAGVFYASLRGKYDRELNRTEALADPNEARRCAYRHTGRFDTLALPFLDSRPDAFTGDQFNYRRTKSGAIHGACREALSSAEFGALLDHVELEIQNMGRRIYAGMAELSPYRKGTMTACEQCEYHAICRIDPWTHRFRVLRKDASDERKSERCS